MVHLTAGYCDSSVKELRYSMSLFFINLKCLLMLWSMRATEQQRINLLYTQNAELGTFAPPPPHIVIIFCQWWYAQWKCPTDQRYSEIAFFCPLSWLVIIVISPESMYGWNSRQYFQNCLHVLVFLFPKRISKAAGLVLEFAVIPKHENGTYFPKCKWDASAMNNVWRWGTVCFTKDGAKNIPFTNM